MVAKKLDGRLGRTYEVSGDGGYGGEYDALYKQYSSASEGQAVAFRNALSTPLSGCVYGGAVLSQGSYGFFESFTRDSSAGTVIDYLDVSSSRVHLSSSGDRANGYSLRCLLSS
ncbi:hypothetical protein IKF21_02080 [Candidatus Saccharibacteria bacterium]|nr:hypothetical protein [Candidatus Saccharibacteria bacterium]